MTKQDETTLNRSLALGAALIALLVASSGANAAFSQIAETQTGGQHDWFEQLRPDVDPGSGGYRIEGGEEDPPDYRAHSDVPDLPDGDGPEAANGGGGSLFEEPRGPSLTDVLFPEVRDGFRDTPLDPIEPFTRDDWSVEEAGGLSVPTPGTVLLLGLGGIGASRRRRRR